MVNDGYGLQRSPLCAVKGSDGIVGLKQSL